MRSAPILFLIALAVAVLLTPSAHAHVDAGETSGFLAGLLHPLTGLDHIVAMVAIGLWAIQIGGRAIWTVPLAFVVTMAIGGTLGMLGVPFPGIEVGIVASDLLLGLAILFAPPLPLLVSGGVAAFLALFHGYAHGTEMAPGSPALLYSLGFLLSTIGLHLAGILAGYGIKQIKPDRDYPIRVAGGVVVAVSLYILANFLNIL
ncbi:MAG: HupE/UreJ family protein [Pseudanabaenaceae cyanobacterium SKYGB_i_bin29]|nr:HupE/UreJ family protein [Pseudanabaenaceae cyanobacterium SKYG29]MDW8420628.1 HupE/UreJ family protein [Pseudanabaenaceae cyanobacterium SKYGB_i_bin29]